MDTQNLSTLKIHKLTQAQYDRELAAGNIDATALYLTPDEAITLSSLGVSATVSELNYCHGVTSNIQTQLNGKAPSSHTHSYLPLSGGTLTGSLTASVNSNGVVYNKVQNSAHSGSLYVSEAGNFGLFSTTCNGWLIRVDTAGVAYIPRTLFVSDSLCFGTSSASPNATYSKNGISSTAAKVIITSSDASIALATHFRPNNDNLMSCGTSGFRWTQVFAKTTAISSSDRNAKKDFRTFDSNENYEKFFMDLKPTVFKYIDGESGRDHFGYISQDVEESLYKYGFNDKSFAGFCKDLRVKEVETEDGKIEEIPVLDENGNKQYDYALRYSEFISLNTHMIQKLYKKIELLEAEIEELKSK